MNSIIPLYPTAKRDAWRVERHDAGEAGGKAQAGKPGSVKTSAIRRVFGRTEPTAFHRCLAVHMYYAGHPSALD